MTSSLTRSRDTMWSKSYDIIIVGAGLSGLATAISCASHGHSVQVIEQAKELAEVRPSCPVHDAPS